MITGSLNGEHAIVGVVSGSGVIAGRGGVSSVDIDTTLTQSGKAADAKATGDAIGKVAKDLNIVETNLTTKVDNICDRVNSSDKKIETVEDTLVDVENSIGDIESALDSIIALQNSLIGGGT